MVSDPEAFPDCEFWFVRHAETEWNRAGRWQGHADPALSAEGRRQAEVLANRVVAEPEAGELGPLLCSDLVRCVETATALGRHLGLEPQTDARLRELDVGQWSGCLREEIAARDGDLLMRFDAEDPDARPPGGETRREIRERAHAVTKEFAQRYPDSRILVVTHRGLIRALLPGMDLANAELIRVGADDALTRRARNSTAADSASSEGGAL